MNYLISTVDKLTKQDIDYIQTNYPVRYLKASKLPNEQQFKASVLAYILLIKLIGDFKEEDVYYNEYKKPYIKNKPFFNISHSGEFVAVVSDDKEVGVDIQKIEEKNLKLMKFFNEDDQEYIKKDDSVNRFHEIWSIKEAAIKLMGTGLTTPLKDVIIYRGHVEINGMKIKSRCKLIPPGYSLCFCYLE